MYYNTGYAEFDNLTEEEYLSVRLSEFKEFQRVVKDTGVVLYNLSYTHENPVLPNLLVAKVHQETDLTLADIIYWKKSNAIPFQTSPTKLSRIVEPVYVFVQKKHLTNFTANKTISKINEKTKQKFYKNYLNYIEAPNNDQNKAPLKALYSTDLVCQLIDVYFPVGSLIYDPFMGSGTTAKGCIKMGRDYIGSELKEEHYNFAIENLK
jgi:DNA modification methylase